MADAPDYSQPIEGEEQYSDHDLQNAYHMASQKQDADAMAQIHAMQMRAIQRNQINPTSDMSGPARFAAGMGHGAVRLGEGLANLVGAKGQLGSFNSTDEGLREEDQRAKALMDTRGGWWGDLAGQAAATAPLGMGTGALAKAGEGAAGKVLPGAVAKLSAWAAENPWKTKVLLNTLKTGDAAAQGATQAAAMADPDQQGEAAESGALFGAGLSKLGQAGGRLVRGAVSKSKALLGLEEEANKEGRDIFVPVSQGAGPGAISRAAKATYQHVLPYALGVEDVLGGQAERAKGVVRDVRADMARPDFLHEEGGVKAPETVAGPTAEATAKNLSETHAADIKNAFDNYTFNQPFAFRDQVTRELDRIHPNMPEALREQLANAVDQNLSLFSKNGQITGENLRGAMEGAQRDMDKLGKNYRQSWKDTAVQPMRDIVDSAINDHEDIIRNSDSLKEVKNARQFVEDMANYKSLAAKDPEVAAIVRATEGAPAERGAYEFKTALRDQVPGTPAYRLLQNAHEVLGEESPGNVTPAGRHLFHAASVATPAVGLATGHGNAGILGPAAFITGAHGLARENTQKFLYGDTAWQKALANAIKTNPNRTRAIGAAARAGVVGANE